MGDVIPFPPPRTSSVALPVEHVAERSADKLVGRDLALWREVWVDPTPLQFRVLAVFDLPAGRSYDINSAAMFCTLETFDLAEDARVLAAAVACHFGKPLIDHA